MVRRWIYGPFCSTGFIRAFDKPQNSLKRRLFQKTLALNMKKTLAQKWFSTSRLPRGYHSPPAANISVDSVLW